MDVDFRLVFVGVRISRLLETAIFFQPRIPMRSHPGIPNEGKLSRKPLAWGWNGDSPPKQEFEGQTECVKRMMPEVRGGGRHSLAELRQHMHNVSTIPWLAGRLCLQGFRKASGQ